MLERLTRPIDGLQLDMSLTKVQDDLGVEAATFASIDPMSGSITAASTYNKDWQEFYRKNDYHLIDPALQVATQSVVPVYWKTLKGAAGYREVFERGADFGITNIGISVPVRGYFGQVGLLSVMLKDSKKECCSSAADMMTYLQQSAVYLSDKITFSKGGVAKSFEPRLDLDEVNVLQCAAMGKDSSEIADALSLSERMTLILLRSARTKLRALTTPQAVGRAIMLGAINT